MSPNCFILALICFVSSKVGGGGGEIEMKSNKEKEISDLKSAASLQRVAASLRK